MIKAIHEKEKNNTDYNLQLTNDNLKGQLYKTKLYILDIQFYFKDI